MITIVSYIPAPNFPDIVFDADSLVGLDLSRKRFHRYILRDLDMSDCNFFLIDGRNTRFEKSRLERANFTSADLMNAFFDGCCFDGAIFKKAVLIGTSFVGASLVGADLTNAQMEGANLRGADLTNAILIGAHYSESTIWPADFAPAPRGAILVDDYGNPL